MRKLTNPPMDGKKSRKAPTDLGLRVYDAIVASLAKGRNRYQGKIRRSELASQLGCSVSAITVHLRALKARGFIDYKGKTGPNGYTYVWLTARNLYDHTPRPTEIPDEDEPVLNRRAAQTLQDDAAITAAIREAVTLLTTAFNEAVARAYDEGYKAGRQAGNERFRRFLKSLERGDND